MNVISNILYWISTGLLVPVIVLLIFFFIRAIILIGTFFGQYLQVKKTANAFYARIEKLTPSTLDEFSDSLPEKNDSIVMAYSKKILANRDNAPRIDLLLSEYEIEADKDLSTSKVLTKMGPILGLMGTLIPMGPALVGLATGDIASMAYNMQVAFATTVVGLVVSAIGFLTQQVKERWAVKNITMLEYLAEVIKLVNTKSTEA
ncbi:MAG: MotA/TolQ/ExbB proton channel family protein [Bacteroides sp.]|nr:MotA/TolQ/ExbB proton channel family protein [Bacteroides sp.]